jgi:hypothetical protein
LILDPGPALAVGAAAAVWPTFLHWTRFIETETLFLFLLSCFLLMCARELLAPSPRWTRRLGLAASATGVVLCRSVGILVVGGALLVLLGASVRRRRGAASARRAVLAAALISALTVVGVLALPPTREKVLGHTNVAWALYLSTTSFHSDLDHAQRRTAPPEDLRDLPREEQNQELSERGLNFIRERPADYMSRVGIRFSNFLFPWLEADWSRAHLALDMFLSLGLIALALGAAFVPSPRPRREFLVLLAVVIAIQTLVVTFGEIDSDGRYRVPVELPLLLLAGVTFEWAHRRRRTVPPVARAAATRPEVYGYGQSSKRRVRA